MPGISGNRWTRGKCSNICTAHQQTPTNTRIAMVTGKTLLLIVVVVSSWLANPFEWWAMCASQVATNAMNKMCFDGRNRENAMPPRSAPAGKCARRATAAAADHRYTYTYRYTGTHAVLVSLVASFCGGQGSLPRVSWVFLILVRSSMHLDLSFETIFIFLN